MSAKGTATIDFGAAPGSYVASVVVSGLTTILADSYADAFVMADTSADHNAIEHTVAPVRLTCGAVIAGVGFTISAISDMKLTGTFTIRWVWA